MIKKGETPIVSYKACGCRVETVYGLLKLGGVASSLSEVTGHCAAHSTPSAGLLESLDIPSRSYISIYDAGAGPFIANSRSGAPDSPAMARARQWLTDNGFPA